MHWHKTKISYYDYDIKKISELALIFGVSYGDVEAQLVTCLQNRVENYDTPGINRKEYKEVIFNNSKLPFYEVKIKIDDGDDKFSYEVYLIPAESPKDAEEKIDAHLKSGFLSYTVEDTIKTKIIGVWDAKNEIWRGDFLNRMDLLKEQGKCSAKFRSTVSNNDDNGIRDPRSKKGKKDKDKEKAKQTDLFADQPQSPNA